MLYCYDRGSIFYIIFFVKLTSKRASLNICYFS